MKQGSPMKLVIGHLYPDLMNTYGDRGNIVALVMRARWRGIEVEIMPISLGETPDLSRVDLFFFGGGQDKEQRLVSQDLVQYKKGPLTEAVENGTVALGVCGGYQLLGKYYRTGTGEELPGVGVLDVVTEAGDQRFIGNVVLQTALPLGELTTLVGFENHSGRTYLGSGVRPLGKVLVGYGNNGRDGQEGCIYKNAFGTYLHGPLLPKNPHFTDYLIKTALSRRYGPVELPPLDDTLELRAHQAAIANARVKKG